MKSTKKKTKDNFLLDKSYQEKLNSTISSDTLRILSLLKSYPSTTASTSFQVETKQNSATFNNNQNTENNNKMDNLSYEQIKAVCLKIFMFYAEPIRGEFFLTQRLIFRILKEMEILHPNCLSHEDIEIIIRQINKKGDKLNSEQFLDLLAKICCLLDDTFYKDKRESFNKLVKLYIEPYIQKKEKMEKENYKYDLNGKPINHSFMSYEKINLNLNFKDLILNEYKLDKDSFAIN